MNIIRVRTQVHATRIRCDGLSRHLPVHYYCGTYTLALRLGVADWSAISGGSQRYASYKVHTLYNTSVPITETLWGDV